MHLYVRLGYKSSKDESGCKGRRIVFGVDFQLLMNPWQAFLEASEMWGSSLGYPALPTTNLR